jgi:hypothetical protein
LTFLSGREWKTFPKKIFTDPEKFSSVVVEISKFWGFSTLILRIARYNQIQLVPFQRLNLKKLINFIIENSLISSLLNPLGIIHISRYHAYEIKVKSRWAS